MRVLVTGASGLVGRRTVDALIDHEVWAASRHPEALELPAHATRVQWPGGDLPDVDSVIHLAGASIGGQRWTRPYQQEIRNSRVTTTQELASHYGPDTDLVCANAVGYYGMNPDGLCTPQRGAGEDYLAQVCQAWQDAAMEHGGRTAVVRFGHVLAPGEGLLGRLEPLHKMRVAGVVPPGTQSLPWIEAMDLAHLLATAATTQAQGVHHGVAGNVAYKDLHRALCSRLGGLKSLKIPAVALRLRLGAFAPYLMGGQEVEPGTLPAWAPQWTDLEATLDHLYS